MGRSLPFSHRKDPLLHRRRGEAALPLFRLRGRRGHFFAPHGEGEPDLPRSAQEPGRALSRPPAGPAAGPPRGPQARGEAVQDQRAGPRLFPEEPHRHGRGEKGPRIPEEAGPLGRDDPDAQDRLRPERLDRPDRILPVEGGPGLPPREGRPRPARLAARRIPRPLPRPGHLPHLQPDRPGRRLRRPDGRRRRAEVPELAGDARSTPRASSSTG